VAPVSKPALPNRIQILAKLAFSKLDHDATLPSAGFETGAAERALLSYTFISDNLGRADSYPDIG